jgi:deoxycytidylate deaminase
MPVKKIPVIFFDEAHKLYACLLLCDHRILMFARPALVQSNDAMKCLLDSMLVLTKQDRLCHVIHATSDPFYQTWLRQLNVMQHCKVCTAFPCNLK